MSENQKSMQVELQRRYNELMEWVKAEPGRCAWSNDPTDEYIVELAQRGIFSIEEYDLEEDRCTLSDIYKEVWGVRPYFNPWELSAEQIKAEMTSLREHSRRNREYEAQHAAEEAAGLDREQNLLLESPVLANFVIPEEF